MTIETLDMTDREVAEEVWALQHQAYRREAAIIGVVHLPPLQDTVESLQAGKQIFIGKHNDDGELLGVLSYKKDNGGSYEICRLMVDSGYLRQGIGASLVKEFLSRIPHSSITCVTAEIRNLPALMLYKQSGFKEYEILPLDSGIQLVSLRRSPQSMT